ncbi:hypothetical protein NN561_001526 [Cricetulus griseus]
MSRPQMLRVTLLGHHLLEEHRAPPARTAAKGAAHSRLCPGLGRPCTAPPRSRSPAARLGHWRAEHPTAAPGRDTPPITTRQVSRGGRLATPHTRKVTLGAASWSGSATRDGPRSSPARDLETASEPQLPDPGVRAPTRRGPRPRQCSSRSQPAPPPQTLTEKPAQKGQEWRTRAEVVSASAAKLTATMRHPSAICVAPRARTMRERPGHSRKRDRLRGSACGRGVRGPPAGGIAPLKLSPRCAPYRGAEASCAGCGDRLPADSRGCDARPPRAGRAGQKAGLPQPAPVPAPMPPPLRRARRPRGALSRSFVRALPRPSAGASLCAGRELPRASGASLAAERWAREGAGAGAGTRRGAGSGRSRRCVLRAGASSRSMEDP